MVYTASYNVHICLLPHSFRIVCTPLLSTCIFSAEHNPLLCSSGLKALNFYKETGNKAQQENKPTERKWEKTAKSDKEVSAKILIKHRESICFTVEMCVCIIYSAPIIMAEGSWQE